MVATVTDNTFKTEVEDHQGVVVVDFWATWCKPCAVLSPVVDTLSEEIKNVKFVKVDIDENFGVASRYGVRSIPTLVRFENGAVKNVKVGVQSLDNLRTWLAQ